MQPLRGRAADVDLSVWHIELYDSKRCSQAAAPRTCETMLGSLGVSSDAPAQLQSDDLGRMQTRHYYRHDYMAEKRQSLSTWGKQIELLKAAATANVAGHPSRDDRGNTGFRYNRQPAESLPVNAARGTVEHCTGALMNDLPDRPTSIGTILVTVVALNLAPLGRSGSAWRTYLRKLNSLR